MTPVQWTYLIFGIALLLALTLDLGVLSKKNHTVTIKKALRQTIFWVVLAMCFFVFMWLEDGHQPAIEYLSAYLMEWSLSIDNIFVFILIFKFFKVPDTALGRVLLIGVLMAIVLRIIFISVGVVLVHRISWILYIFGAFLIYTGIKLFSSGQDEAYDPSDTRIYRYMKRHLRLTEQAPHGKYLLRDHGKTYLTSLAVVVIILATTDIVFALDSLPAIFAISTRPLVVYTSNIFAVLGLRSLFFLLKGAVNKFSHLQQGIAIVLIFIGLKMLVGFFHWQLPEYVSLIVIVACLGGSILYSLYQQKKHAPPRTNHIV